MANTFYQVEYFPRLNNRADHNNFQKRKFKSTPSSFLTWDVSSDLTNCPSFLGSNSINTMQLSPSTRLFPNFDVSTTSGNGISSGISSYIPKVSLDTFNLGVFEDWICWENQSNRAPSLSPTKTINTTVTTPPEIYFKSEASQSPILSSLGLGNAKKPSLNDSHCILGEGHMENAISFDEEDVHSQSSYQKLPRSFTSSRPLLNDQKEEYSFQYFRSSESPLNLIDEERSDINNGDDKINIPSKLIDVSTVGCNSLSDLPFTPQGQHSCPPNLTDNGSEKHEKEKSTIEETQIKFQNTEYFDIESNMGEETCLFSSSYSFQTYTGPNPQKSKPVRSIPRKRKSHDFHNTKKGSPNTGNSAWNLCSSRNPDEIKEIQVNGIVHSDGRTKPPKKTAHNMIEKRYRTNLNDKIAALRDAVPSLRVAVKCDLSFVQEGNKNEHIDKKNEQKKDEQCGNSLRNGTLKGEINEEQDLPVVHKLNKATILTKAAEYIAFLEKRNHKLLSENSALETRINAFEILKLSPKSKEI
ncbi:hypothetical protein OnM2_022078 [Erysiphe neolycopersici]|uniref:BHLH domain-containing protein n=1 Tax=Erysiphe neolycopersici TaxID=212602 RepID=A0A420I2Q2_9PEZI|nr:hypothetical protein OnM2_022078 [Erysiphe neolycopersici]